MIPDPTVLILGAGASIPYGFPSGLQLQAMICEAIQTQEDIREDLAKSIGPEASVQDFYNNLLLSSEMSIDAFLEHNRKYLDIGRRAIANVLLRKESHNKLFYDWIEKRLNERNTDKHWYQLLFSKLNATFEDFENNNLKIITFNYDRSLEYFLWNSMSAKYSEEDKGEVLKKLHTIPILHIYGKLGTFQAYVLHREPVLYDSEGDLIPYDLLRDPSFKNERQRGNYIYLASQNIFTIHQAEEMKGVIAKARDFMNKAQRIYFLGFGYDKTNMELLFLENQKNLLIDKDFGQKCFGTVMDLSPHHKNYLLRFGLKRLQDDINNAFHGLTYKPPFFSDSTIYDFLYYNANSKLD
jgi:hypothetical protein